MALLNTNEGEITLGLEELFNGGDRDFGGAVFKIDIGQRNASILDANLEGSYIDGTLQTIHKYIYVYNDEGELEKYDSEGNFIGYSEQNDQMFGGRGNDEIFGLAGNHILE